MGNSEYIPVLEVLAPKFAVAVATSEPQLEPEFHQLVLGSLSVRPQALAEVRLQRPVWAPGPALRLAVCLSSPAVVEPVVAVEVVVGVHHFGSGRGRVELLPAPRVW